MDEKDDGKALLNSDIGGLVPLDKWLRSIGKSRSTGWNYRKAGAIKTVNIFGSVYISRSEIARFETRALAGEFECNKQKARLDRVGGCGTSRT